MTRGEPRVVLWLLAILALVAYRGVLTAGFVYEDSPWLPTLQGPTQPGLATLTYAPWLLARALGGGAPWAYHAMILAVHLLNGLLLYRLARQFGLRVGAFVAVAVFWLHPMNSEAVSYLSAGREVLATFWVLLALTVGTLNGPAIWRAAGVALLTALAILSKTSAAPAILLVPIGLTVLSHDRVLLWASRGWLLAVGLLVSVPGVLYVKSLQASEGILYIGWTGLFRNAAVTSAALVRYLTLIVGPVGFTIDHDWIAVDPIWPTLALGSVLVAAGVAWTMRHRWPLMACGVAWLLIALLPRFVVQQREILNEHQVYLAFLPIWMGIGWSLDAAIRRRTDRPERLAYGPGDDTVTLMHTRVRG